MRRKNTPPDDPSAFGSRVSLHRIIETYCRGYNGFFKDTRLILGCNSLRTSPYAHLTLYQSLKWPGRKVGEYKIHFSPNDFSFRTEKMDPEEAPGEIHTTLEAALESAVAGLHAALPAKDLEKIGALPGPAGRLLRECDIISARLDR